VKSMLTSWHNFFFVSFDAGGFVTVDKPPLGLWVQAASAALFGFNGVSLILPQAVAGVLSVLLLYHLVRRTFGPTAGLLAALVLTVTPISVAANRNNTMDSLLVFVLLLAAWAIIRAAEMGRLRWLLAGAVLVGLGFNIKMLQAFLVLPAFYLVYLVSAPVRWWKRLLHLTLATVVLLVVSLAWVVAVDLTPPEERPYVGSSQDNTVLELIIGHNGMARLLPGGLRALDRLGGSSAPPAGARPGRLPSPPPGAQPGRAPGQPPSPPAGGPPAPGRGGGRPFSDETGDPGLLRLFNHQLAGQISWLLPLAGWGSWSLPGRRGCASPSPAATRLCCCGQSGSCRCSSSSAWPICSTATTWRCWPRPSPRWWVRGWWRCGTTTAVPAGAAGCYLWRWWAAPPLRPSSCPSSPTGASG